MFKVVRIHGELEMVHSVPPSSHLILVSPSSLSPSLPFPPPLSPSLQVAHFTATAETSRLGRAFMQTLADKEQLVAPMKDRGNTNFRETRYRAGIADYTRAIKLW